MLLLKRWISHQKGKLFITTTDVVNGHIRFVFQVKGQGIYAFVTLVEGAGYSEELRKSLILTVRKQVGLSATLDDYDQYWP